MEDILQDTHDAPSPMEKTAQNHSARDLVLPPHTLQVL